MNIRTTLRTVGLAGSLALSVFTMGCAEHRYYDPYYHDYHTWNDAEIVYYQRWCVETHRDPHREFRHISHDEQREYWNWRHSHGG
jgi:hypothetical protein